MKGIGSPTLAAVVLAIVAAYAGAQAAPAQPCRIDYGRPGQLKDARNSIITMEALGERSTPEKAKEAYIKAVGLLTREPQRFAQNVVGRNIVLASALVNLALLPETPETVRRGDVGFITEMDGTIDLIATADSLLDEADRLMPQCKEESEGPRRKAYADLVNRSVNSYNDRDVDGALKHAERAVMIYEGYPLAYIAYNVVGNVKQSKDDIPGAIAAFRTMVTLQKADTSLVGERKTATRNVTTLMLEHARSLEGDAKSAALRDAIAFLDEYLAEFPTDVAANLSRGVAMLQMGDTDGAKKIFDGVLASAEGYSDIQLMEAGVSLAQADQNALAAQFFETALKKNQYSRDGLFNLAAIYDGLEQYGKMAPILERLISVDPENPDNYRLWARYWQARARDLKAPAEGKEEKDPAYQAYAKANEELLKYFNRMQDATVKVAFSLFTHDGGNHILGGSVENRTEEEKSYTLKFEFLDGAGTVLDTKEVVVPGVAAKSTKSFRVEVTDKPGVVAFRYAPLAQ